MADLTIRRGQPLGTCFHEIPPYGSVRLKIRTACGDFYPAVQKFSQKSRNHNKRFLIFDLFMLLFSLTTNKSGEIRDNAEECRRTEKAAFRASFLQASYVFLARDCKTAHLIEYLGEPL